MASRSSTERPARKTRRRSFCCTAFPRRRECFEPLFDRLADQLSPGRARLSGLRTQRLARPEAVRLHLRPHRLRDGQFHRGVGFVALHALHAGLRRAGRLSHGIGTPGARQALIVQDAVAHNEGLGANWATRRAFWADRAAHEAALRTNLLSFATTKTRHVGDDPNIELYDPDLWTDEYAFLNSPGQARDPKRSLLRLPHERRCLSKVAGMAAEDPAKALGPLGQARSLVRSRRARTIPQGRPERGSRPRRRPLRA